MTSEPRDLALDFEIFVDGRAFFLTRSLDLARRVESALGALEPLAGRLEKGHVTTTELSLLYQALLKGDPDRIDRADLDDWIFKTGVYAAGRQVAWFVYSLICGNAALALVQERISAAQAEVRKAAERAGSEARGPFGRAA